MGNTRKTDDDDLYNSKREYYLAHKEKILLQAKERYKRDRGMILAIAAKIREEIKVTRPFIEKELLAKPPREVLTEWKTALKVRQADVRARQRAQVFIDSYKRGKPCLDCGVTFPSCAMDFDHVRGKKVRDVSYMVAKGKSDKLLLAEIEKCDLVCANCHRVRHHPERVEQETHAKTPVQDNP